MAFEFISSEIHALLQVIVVDLVLAGDNAIVVGLVAASVPLEYRKKVILIGIVAATVLRILFSFVALQLLAITGLIFAGGLLLLWVGWKLWREIDQARHKNDDGESATSAVPHPKTFRGAVFQIVLADVSMSLDNVLAVAGAARHHTWVLVVGLGLSVALMAWASTFIADLLKRYHWIAYIGLLVVFYIAGAMIWEGAHQLYGQMHPG
jgi:YjbE family integral membrane protein